MMPDGGDGARAWAVALALPGQAPCELGVVVASTFDCAARAVWARWPLLPVGFVTVDGVPLPDRIPLAAPSSQTARQKLEPLPLTEGQRRYRDRLRVHRAGRQSRAQRERQTNTTPRPA